MISSGLVLEGPRGSLQQRFPTHHRQPVLLRKPRRAVESTALWTAPATPHLETKSACTGLTTGLGRPFGPPPLTTAPTAE